MMTAVRRCPIPIMINRARPGIRKLVKGPFFKTFGEIPNGLPGVEIAA